MTTPDLRSACRLPRLLAFSVALPVVISLQACAAPPAGDKLADRQLDTAALIRAGDGAYRQGDFDEARQAYNSVIDAAPTSFAVWLKLGNAHLRQGQAQSAEQAYQKAIELKPDDPRAWYNLATARLMKAKGALRGAAENLDESDPARRLAVQRLRVLDDLIFKALETPTQQSEATVNVPPGPRS
ncbi:MAG: tetratricopeptide repeat protein [Burkholderiaceae bacterium]